MENNALNVINQKLIQLLLAVSESISFPFHAILKNQISASQITYSDSQYVYIIHFHPRCDVQRLPEWIDSMPLSWQVCIDDVPVLCQLFVDHNGYVEDLEIMDMGFEQINWEVFFEKPLCRNFEYNEQCVFNYLSAGPMTLEKIINSGRCVDFMLRNSTQNTVVSFRGCEIHRLPTAQLPMKANIQISKALDNKFRYSIHSTDTNIEFKCETIFIRLNAVID